MNPENTNLFIYRQKEVLPKPFSTFVESTLGNALKMIVTIVGQYESRISALHLESTSVASYHDSYFIPKHALVLEGREVQIERIGEKGKYKTYRLPVKPSSEIISVSPEFFAGDFIFQVGVKNFQDFQVVCGIIEPLRVHLDTEEENSILIDLSAESGSGVFDDKGRLLGMTLGRVGPKVMIATTIKHLLLL